MLARPLSRRISTIFLRSWAHATGRTLLYWHTSLAWYRNRHLYFIRMCSQSYNISRQGAMQASPPPVRTSPAPTRFERTGRTLVLVHSGGFAAALVWQEYIQGIVYGDDAFEHTLRIDHRYSQQVILRHDLGNFAWFRIRLYSNQVGLHEFLQGLLGRGY